MKGQREIRSSDHGKKKIVEMLVHGVYFETRTESETRRKMMAGKSIVSQLLKLASIAAPILLMTCPILSYT